LRKDNLSDIERKHPLKLAAKKQQEIKSFNKSDSASIETGKESKSIRNNWIYQDSRNLMLLENTL